MFLFTPVFVSHTVSTLPNFSRLPFPSTASVKLDTPPPTPKYTAFAATRQRHGSLVCSSPWQFGVMPRQAERNKVTRDGSDSARYIVSEVRTISYPCGGKLVKSKVSHDPAKNRRERLRSSREDKNVDLSSGVMLISDGMEGLGRSGGLLSGVRVARYGADAADISE